jgi:multiple sugar transport system permease protein
MRRLNKLGVERRFAIFGLFPLCVFIIVFMSAPVGNLFYMSVSELHWADGTLRSAFVGLQNWWDFFSDNFYWKGLRNTIIFAVVTVCLQIFFGLVLAMTVKRVKFGRTVLLAVFLLPIIVPPIVIGAMWKLILNADIGVLNLLLSQFEIQRIDWLGSASTALGTVIAVDVWHWTPFTFLLLLAGLESLPTDVYEASRLDTLSDWQELRHITLPLLWPTIAITALFRLILSFKVFDEIYLLTSGGPGTSTEVVSYSIYRTFFSEDRTGMGAVMSLFTLFVIALSAIILVNLRKRETR